MKHYFIVLIRERTLVAPKVATKGLGNTLFSNRSISTFFLTQRFHKNVINKQLRSQKTKASIWSKKAEVFLQCCMKNCSSAEQLKWRSAYLLQRPWRGRPWELTVNFQSYFFVLRWPPRTEFFKKQLLFFHPFWVFLKAVLETKMLFVSQLHHWLLSITLNEKKICVCEFRGLTRH